MKTLNHLLNSRNKTERCKSLISWRARNICHNLLTTLTMKNWQREMIILGRVSFLLLSNHSSFILVGGIQLNSVCSLAPWRCLSASSSSGWMGTFLPDTLSSFSSKGPSWRYSCKERGERNLSWEDKLCGFQNTLPVPALCTATKTCSCVCYLFVLHLLQSLRHRNESNYWKDHCLHRCLCRCLKAECGETKDTAKCFQFSWAAKIILP